MAHTNAFGLIRGLQFKFYAFIFQYYCLVLDLLILSITPFACTLTLAIMSIVYTFYSDSQLMKLVTSSNATFLPIRILPTTTLSAVSGTLNGFGFP